MSLSADRTDRLRFAGLIPSCFFALSAAACTTVAQKLPLNSAASGSPDSVVIMGKVELRGDVERLSGTSAKLKIRPAKGWPSFSPIIVPVILDEEFYVVIPREVYVFVDLDWGHIFEHNREIECDNLGFSVPKQASAIYVGTLVFQIANRPWQQGILYGHRSVTLSVKDEYDHAVAVFQERKRNFSGAIVKSLFGRQSELGERDISCRFLKRGGFPFVPP